MSRQEPIQTIRLGDRVAYSQAYLRDVGQLAGTLSSAQGEVQAFVTFGKSTLAEIRWDTTGLSQRVNVARLCLAESRSYRAA